MQFRQKNFVFVVDSARVAEKTAIMSEKATASGVTDLANDDPVKEQNDISLGEKESGVQKKPIHKKN